MTGYLDASALVKLVVPEVETDALLRYLAHHPVQATSVVAAVEVSRAVRRAGLDREERVDEVLDRVVLVALDDIVLRDARALPPTVLRTLDAIHVATARQLGGSLEALVTYDDRLAEAARGFGIRVASPGRE